MQYFVIKYAYNFCECFAKQFIQLNLNNFWLLICGMINNETWFLPTLSKRTSTGEPQTTQILESKHNRNNNKSKYKT